MDMGLDVSHRVTRPSEGVGSMRMTVTINPGAAEHPHRQIAAQIRAQIRRGDWAPGERLPSIPAIAADVRRGQADRPAHHRPAAHRGRPDHQARLGHVRARHPAQAQPPVPRPVRRTARLPRRPGRPVPPAAHRGRPLPRPGEIADVFGVPAGTELVVRRHLVRTQDAPVEVGASWLRPADADGTSLARGEAVRPAALPGGRGGHRPGLRDRDRPGHRPPAHPRGGGDPADPSGHAGAAPAARRLRRRPPADRGGGGDLARAR